MSNAKDETLLDNVTKLHHACAIPSYDTFLIKRVARKREKRQRDRHLIEGKVESTDPMTSNLQALLIIAHLDNKTGGG